MIPNVKDWPPSTRIVIILVLLGVVDQEMAHRYMVKHVMRYNK